MKLKAISLAMVVFGMLAASAVAQMPMAQPYGAVPPGAVVGASHPGMPMGPAMHGPYPGMPPVMAHPVPMHPGMAPPMGDCAYGPIEAGGVACGCGDCGCCDQGCCDQGCCDGGVCFGRYGGCGCGCGLLGNLFGCCCDPCRPPCWRVRLESLSMSFRRPDEPAVTSTIGTMAVLGDGLLDFDYETSFRVTLERRLAENHGVEFTYFGLHHWNDSAQAVDPAGAGGITSPYQTLAGAAVAGYDGANQHRIAYGSRLHNAEVNYWVPVICRRIFQASFMYGGRYIRIDENFAYDGISATTLGETDIHAVNNIFGPQMGVMTWFPLNRQVSVRFDGKVGAFYNFAEQETTITQTTVPGIILTDYTETADTNKASFALDISLALVTQLTPCSSVYVGYQAVWLDELVLASEQFNPVFPTAMGRPVLINDRGHRLYHGVMSGFEYTW